ncbi:MAG: aminopeptidase [Candidatus Micrarchaeota archaeon]|nr:aminopeptidase [Candidatus Micrarchaeota archaeon]
MLSVLRKNLGLKRSERFLVVTDKNLYDIGKIFFDQAYRICDCPEIVVKPVGKRHGEEPPEYVSLLMKEADVVVAVTTHSLTHTKARMDACKSGTRIASMPGFDERMFFSLAEDPGSIRKRASRLKKLLKPGARIEVISDNGTSLEFTVPSKIFIDDGLLTKPGSYGNLPAGEICFLPLSVSGRLVVDHGGPVESGAEIEIKNSRAVSVCGSKYLEKIFRSVKNSNYVGEFGIGLNSRATIIGKILQDEKVLGTCHFALGSGASFGGLHSEVHLDLIITKPKIKINGKKV